MKSITEKLSLSGQVETISISDLRKTPGDILKQVEMGATFNIQRNGRLIAVLARPDPDAFALGAAARRAGIVK